MGKLKLYGIRGIAYIWFESYLKDRKQYVSINGFNSKFERNVLVVHVTLVKPNVMQKLDEMNIIN